MAEKEVSENSEQATLEALGRTVPHSPEAEAAVLGAVLLDNNKLDDITQVLDYTDFYINRHREIYKAMLRLYDARQNIEYITLEEELKKALTEEEFGGLDYLTSLPDKVPYAATIEQHTEIIRKNSIRRKIIALSFEMNQKAFNNMIEVPDLLDELESKVFKITQGDIRSEAFSIKEILNNLFNMEAFLNPDSQATGVPSGFTYLDDLTGGFQRGEMIVIAARPSMGKTTLALNIAKHVSVVGNIPCAFFSCEMSRQQLVQNMLCSQARIDTASLRTGRLTEIESSSLATAAGQLAEAPLYIDDTPGITLRELSAKARRLVQQYDIQILFIDYLQLMTPPKLGRSATREQEISVISRGLKALARELNIPVVVLAQLNREVEKRQGRQGTNKPRMSDLRESGAIEQDADVIILLHRDYYYTRREEDRNKALLIVAKQRNGPTGDVEVAYVMNHMLFDNLASGYDGVAPFDDYGDNSESDFTSMLPTSLPEPEFPENDTTIEPSLDEYDDDDLPEF